MPPKLKPADYTTYHKGHLLKLAEVLKLPVTTKNKRDEILALISDWRAQNPDSPFDPTVALGCRPEEPVPTPAKNSGEKAGQDLRAAAAASAATGYVVCLSGRLYGSFIMT